MLTSRPMSARLASPTRPDRAPGIPAALLGLALALSTGCQELPAELADFEDRCLRLNVDELPPTPDDPHDGYKVVYACDVPLDAAQAAPPWPDATLIVKASRRGDQDFPWLVATARKDAGTWSWTEYTRNFADEPLLDIGASEAVCVDCHRAVEAADWIFTRYDGPPLAP